MISWGFKRNAVSHCVYTSIPLVARQCFKDEQKKSIASDHAFLCGTLCHKISLATFYKELEIFLVGIDA